MVKKNYLVRYNICCGEYEFSGQTILTLNSKAKIENEVHNYFKDFYADGCEEDSERLNYYTYNFGCVAVKKICWDKITEAQAKVLHDLNIA